MILTRIGLVFFVMIIIQVSRTAKSIVAHIFSKVSRWAAINWLMRLAPKLPPKTTKRRLACNLIEKRPLPQCGFNLSIGNGLTNGVTRMIQLVFNGKISFQAVISHRNGFNGFGQKLIGDTRIRVLLLNERLGF